MKAGVFLGVVAFCCLLIIPVFAGVTEWTLVNSSPGWTGRFGHGQVVAGSSDIDTDACMPVVIMGGYTGAAYKNDTWISRNCGNTWSQQNSTAPWVGRFEFGAVAVVNYSNYEDYEDHGSPLMNDTIVIFGGSLSGSVFKNDSWASYDVGRTWYRTCATAPWPSRTRFASATVYNITTNSDDIIIIGGVGNGGNFNDTWRSADKGASWTRVCATPSWPARYDISAGYIHGYDAILISGGVPALVNNSWLTSNGGTSWTIANATVAPWVGRYRQSSFAFYDSDMYYCIAGGQSATPYFNDTWCSWNEGGNWQLLNASPGWLGLVGTRIDTTMNMSLDDTEVVMTGGSWTVSYSDDVYRILPSFPIPDFSGTPRFDRVNTQVDFVDMSTGSYLTNWSWDFGDFNSSGYNTSYLRNPSHEYITAGNYTVTLVVASGLGNATELKTDYITAGYGLELTYKDIQTLSVITEVNCTAVWTGGGFNGTAETSTGVIDLVVPSGGVAVHSGALGYKTVTTNVEMVSDGQTEIIYMTPEVPAITSVYGPHHVQFIILDQYGTPVPSASVFATAINATIPDVWLMTMYMYDADTANEVMNGTLVMDGVSGPDGAVVFTMLAPVGYNITVDPPTGTTSVVSPLYPIDTQYNIYIGSDVFPSTSSYNTLPAWNFTLEEPNVSYVTLGFWYQDVLGLTTSLKFNITDSINGSRMYSKDWGAPGTGPVSTNWTVLNQRGHVYTSNFTAVRT